MELAQDLLDIGFKMNSAQTLSIINLEYYLWLMQDLGLMDPNFLFQCENCPRLMMSPYHFSSCVHPGFKKFQHATNAVVSQAIAMMEGKDCNNEGTDDDPYIESTPDKMIEYLKESKD